MTSTSTPRRAGLTEASFEGLRFLVGVALGGPRKDGELGAAMAFVLGWV
jgi:hypothetical protein